MQYIVGRGEREAKKYLEEAVEEALKSTCRRSRCGSVIVKDHYIIGRGFNSPPGDLKEQRRCSFKKSKYHKKVTDKTCCVHAEERAIMNALRENPWEIAGAKLYFARIDQEGNLLNSGQPYCTICSKMALDVGIAEFILRQHNLACSYQTDEYNLLSFNYKD